MKKILAIALLCFIPKLAPAQEKESFTVSPEYAKLLKNCCAMKKESTQEKMFGNLRSSREEFASKLLKKRKLRLHATNTLHYKEEWSFRAKRSYDGYFVGIGYESNRDPIKLLFEPIVSSFFNPVSH